MAKRTFRPSSDSPDDPRYPRLDDPDHGRRSFLVKLGGALLGAGALAACGGRPVNTAPDAGKQPVPPVNMGGALPMDARADQQPAPDQQQPEPPDGLP